VVRPRSTGLSAATRARATSRSQVSSSIAHSSGETLNNIQPGWSPDFASLRKIQQGKRGEQSVAVADYDYAMRPLMDEMITRKSVEGIRAHAKDAKPFFLYVPFSLPHAPPLRNAKVGRIAVLR
jgi:hypothetical protein